MKVRRRFALVAFATSLLPPLPALSGGCGGGSDDSVLVRSVTRHDLLEMTLTTRAQSRIGEIVPFHFTVKNVGGRLHSNRLARPVQH